MVMVVCIIVIVPVDVIEVVPTIAIIVIAACKFPTIGKTKDLRNYIKMPCTIIEKDNNLEEKP